MKRTYVVLLVVLFTAIAAVSCTSISQEELVRNEQSRVQQEKKVLTSDDEKAPQTAAEERARRDEILRDTQK